MRPSPQAAITLEWTAHSRERWTIPLSGQLDRVFDPAKQSVSASVQAFYNVDTPASNLNPFVSVDGRSAISDDHGRIGKRPSRRKVFSRPPLPIFYQRKSIRRQPTVFLKSFR